ncbi:nucleic acid-binding protein [Camellia ringspot associated virus 3]|nr:nucleic acid-binding protein [Camellia ringspot associated virus 3]
MFHMMVNPKNKCLLSFWLCLSKLGLSSDLCFVFILVALSRGCLRGRCSSAFNGTSRSAVKRRAARFQKCRLCGKWSHSGKCPNNQTNSQSEVSVLLRLGTIRFLTENPKYFRKNSVASELALSILNSYKSNRS